MFRTGGRAKPHLASPDQTEHLAHALLSDDEVAGATIGIVYLTYLAGAARLMGEWWNNGDVTFVEVAIGTSRIQSIMRTSNHHFMSKDGANKKSAVFATVPGETHTLGVRIAADLFRKEGWDIDLKIGRSHDELVGEIERKGHRLIGLSSSGRHSSAALARLVAALESRIPGAAIVVSGVVADDEKDLRSLLGIDSIASDVPTARAALDRLWQGAVACESCLQVEHIPLA